MAVNLEPIYAILLALLIWPESEMMTSGKTKRISIWSGPRNVSTALMYSFAQRPDTRVFDEPLYAHYLSMQNERPLHPREEEILQAQSNDGAQVVREVLLSPESV